MSSSRTTSHMSSTPQSLPSRPPPIPADDGFEGTPASREATTDETDASPCEFEIDWENIWHGGKRLMGSVLDSHAMKLKLSPVSVSYELVSVSYETISSCSPIF
ncbi:uncharacterized protein FPOAC1_013614 [Fusarium poae]|uniref:uncharacterized protein n=1 Tax=Fusarium poae TaxID=36050 RepID=UPI001D045A5B|nr:uncharacterized protein FPOAC1_013614 [Fusarium poae]KAG8664834.1 hypothetical protein FPOAC1_013614 [Fusarium poae]